MKYEDFKKHTLNAISKYPRSWRKGQAVYNYIDETYHVANRVVFKYNIDCFYSDKYIDDFLRRSWDVLCEQVNTDD